MRAAFKLDENASGLPVIAVTPTETAKLAHSTGYLIEGGVQFKNTL